MLRPHELQLPRVVKVAKELSKETQTDPFTFENFSEFEFEDKKQIFYIRKISGKSLLDDTPYDIKRFQLRDTTLVDEFTIWFSMGPNEKTVVLWGDLCIGVLKIEESFFVFDPNFRILSIYFLWVERSKNHKLGRISKPFF